MKNEISPQEYKQMRDDQIPHVLLDVRQAWEVQKASIPGSKHIPLTELMEHADELNKKDRLVVYCHHGVRSMNACFFLRELGFEDVISLSGGIDSWSKQI